MSQRVMVVEQILNANDQLAAENRLKLDANGVFAINILASPGAGKTSVILRTIEALSKRLHLGVVEGDTAPVTIDADKVSDARHTGGADQHWRGLPSGRGHVPDGVAAVRPGAT